MKDKHNIEKIISILKASVPAGAAAFLDWLHDLEKREIDFLLSVKDADSFRFYQGRINMLKKIISLFEVKNGK